MYGRNRNRYGLPDAFKGLGRRTRLAFLEAEDVASTRIARVAHVIVPLARGGGEAATANRVALGDVTNAGRRGEATEARGIAALRGERVKEGAIAGGLPDGALGVFEVGVDEEMKTVVESAEEALRAAEAAAARVASETLRAAEAAARAANEDAARRAQEGFRVADSVVTNVPNVGEEAARPALGGDALPVGADIDGTGEAVEGENAQTSDITGTDSLRHVDRARGINAASALRALVDAGGGDGVARCLAGDRVVAGVDVAEAFGHLVGWVRPSIGAIAFQGWLNTSAPAFPSLTVPEDLNTIFLGGGVAAAIGLREFVADYENGSSPGKFRSPLLSGESTFARMKHNAVHVAAWALGASDDERREALAEAARHANARVFTVRATYVWFIRCESGQVYVYVGESTDVERRISTHFENLFDRQDDDPRLQRGHALARRECAATKDQAHFCVISAHNEQSARSLAQSYVLCAANIRCDRFSDASMTCRILEVARACAASGFYSEMVYTAQFRSMHAERTADRFGLNFSQPGVMHPQRGGVDDAIDTMTWEQVKVKFGKTTTTTTTRTAAGFTCGACEKEIASGARSFFNEKGGERICKACHESTRRGRMPACTCAVCAKEIVSGKMSFSHGNGGERICKACYESKRRAKHPGFWCSECAKEVAPGKGRSHPHKSGGGRICHGCYERARRAKMRAFKCSVCAKEVSRGNRSYGDGDERICEVCYKRARRALKRSYLKM